MSLPADPPSATAPPRILVVDDEAIARRNLAHVLEREGYEVTSAGDGLEAIALLRARRFDVVLTDLRMEGADGLAVLSACREARPDCEVIVITGFASTDSAVEAMKRGAFHYVAKPYRFDEVRRVLAEAVEKVQLKRDNRAIRQRLEHFEGKRPIITQDEAMLNVLATCRQIAPTDCSVIIQGATGTGKELVARYLHEHSRRAAGPFVAINCGAFNDELLASELFGHERGAFTGAVADKAGLIEAANGGTLFLDEITETSPAMQVRLLRVLQEREVQRVGATAPRPVDVRVVAATNRDILARVGERLFREDLYYRLAVVSLRLPGLAERRGDIPPLCLHFIARAATAGHGDVTEIAPDALDRLTAYAFPGNVRELQNIIERAAAVCRSPRITLADLPEQFHEGSGPAFRWQADHPPTLDELERQYIEWTLGEVKGNQTAAAQRLGIDRVSLWRKLKRYLPSGDGTP
jgi:DNA-binding NtrC family response regulator